MNFILQKKEKEKRNQLINLVNKIAQSGAVPKCNQN